MPDHTTSSAAEYLVERGYLVHSKRDGTDKPPTSGTVKQWCERGKIKARKAGKWIWLIDQKELDDLISKSTLTPPHIAHDIAHDDRLSDKKDAARPSDTAS